MPHLVPAFRHKITFVNSQYAKQIQNLILYCKLGL